MVLVKLYRPHTTPKGSFEEGKSPAILGKSRLVNYDNLDGLLFSLPKGGMDQSKHCQRCPRVLLIDWGFSRF